MKLEDIIWFLLILTAAAVVWCFALRQWPCQPAREPIVEGADAVWKPDLGLSPMPIKLKAISRPLIEYPDAASTRSLIESMELERGAMALPRPLIEHSNSAINFALEGPQTSPIVLPKPLVEYPDSALAVALEELKTTPTTLPRPLVEYAGGAIVFALEQPPQGLISSATQAEPRPLVEYADTGWSGGLSPPSGLLKEGGENQ